MSNEDLFFFVALLFLFLSIVSIIFSYINYKKTLSDYESFLSEYRKNGLFVDSITNLTSNFGFILFYMKIMFFIRLLKNKKMYKKKNVLVEKRCYEYMQSIPHQKIKWMWVWRRNYFIQSTFLIITFSLLYAHSGIYNY